MAVTIASIGNIGNIANLTNLSLRPRVVAHDNDIIDPNLDRAGTVNDTEKNDLIVALGGNDTITATAGNDEVRAGEGDDVIRDRGAGFDDLFGEEGKDTFVLGDASGGNVINGGADTDTLQFSRLGSGNQVLFTDGVNVNLETGKVAFDADGTGPADSITGVENVTGTLFGDKITGNGENNLLDGGRGNDTLAGGGGKDTLVGGFGDDTATFENASGGIVATLGENGADGRAVTGGSAADTDVLRGIENLKGSSFNDSLTGNGDENLIEGGLGRDTIRGGGGADTIDGGRSSDVLFGDAGNDDIRGGFGDDTLVGGAGGDTLQGGVGADTFRFDSKGDSTPQTGQFDRIKDFDIANDVLDLSRIDADETRQGNQGFQIVDEQFAGTAGTAFLEYTVDAQGNERTTLVGFTNNSDSVPDFVLEFDGHVDLTQANVLL
jgi:Ca2+-binding RTX toxin-like protein